MPETIYVWPVEFREMLDEVLASWPDVRAKHVFGHRGFVRNGRMFAFFAGNGLSVKAVGNDGERLYALPGVEPFAYAGGEMRGWPVLPVSTKLEADVAIAEAFSAYEKSEA